jgi:hypothetical protein
MAKRGCGQLLKRSMILKFGQNIPRAFEVRTPLANLAPQKSEKRLFRALSQDKTAAT